MGPGRELVETALGMAVDDAADHVGQVGPGLDADQLAGLNQRRDHRPVRGSAVRARKETFLGGVDLNPAVGEEQAQAGPPRERVADRLGQAALLAHQGQLLAQPGLERRHRRPAARLANGAPFVRRPAADLGLDPVQRRNAHERLGGNRRRSTLGEFVKGPAHVAPAEGELHCAPPGQNLVGLVAVHLQHALKPGQMRRGTLFVRSST